MEWPDHHAILTLLFSLPLFSSRSLASSRRAALHGAVEEYARQNGVDLIHLNILEGNESSMRLAGSLGFKRVREF